jgi:hypothetical protein
MLKNSADYLEQSVERLLLRSGGLLKDYKGGVRVQERCVE